MTMYLYRFRLEWDNGGVFYSDFVSDNDVDAWVLFTERYLRVFSTEKTVPSKITLFSKEKLGTASDYWR